MLRVKEVEAALARVLLIIGLFRWLLFLLFVVFGCLLVVLFFVVFYYLLIFYCLLVVFSVFFV